MASQLPSARSLSQGFTLVELLVALFVFSLISAFAYRAVNTLVKTGDAIELEMTALTHTQRAVQIIERDLRQKAVQVVAQLDAEPINLTPENQQLDLSLVSTSSANAKPVLKHIRYRLQDKVLVRELWKNNKDTSDEPDEVVKLLKEVTKVEFTAVDSAGASTSDAWPAYFRVVLEQDNLGHIERNLYFGVKKPDLNFSSLTEATNPPGGGGQDGPPSPLCDGPTDQNCDQ